MPTRPLSSNEESNLQLVRGSVGDYALLFPTANGLKKSILDATFPIRTLLKVRGIHDFGAQLQTLENRIYLDANIIDDVKGTPVSVSCYRPLTKDGDPRIWPSLFGTYANPGDAFALFVHAGRFYFYNLTRSHAAAEIAHGRQTNVGRFLSELASVASSVSVELLSRIRGIAARGPLVSVCKGDTAIGRSIESALGIPMNAKKTPDYNGIELKAYRASKPDNGLITLFSKTPDWDRSVLKSSTDYLRRFGYYSEEKKRNQLYCSVHATKTNSLGFKLRLNKDAEDLEEDHRSQPDGFISVWAMETLHNSLKKKHAETFWIKAKALVDSSGQESFELHSIIHTRLPVIPQFDAFLLNGEVCLDHTIYEEGAGAGDHGYLFRVRQERFTELFTGEPRRYDLR